MTIEQGCESHNDNPGQITSMASFISLPKSGPLAQPEFTLLRIDGFAAGPEKSKRERALVGRRARQGDRRLLHGASPAGSTAESDRHQVAAQ